MNGHGSVAAWKVGRIAGRASSRRSGPRASGQAPCRTAGRLARWAGWKRNGGSVGAGGRELSARGSGGVGGSDMLGGLHGELGDPDGAVDGGLGGGGLGGGGRDGGAGGEANGRRGSWRVGSTLRRMSEWDKRIARAVVSEKVELRRSIPDADVDPPKRKRGRGAKQRKHEAWLLRHKRNVAPLLTASLCAGVSVPQGKADEEAHGAVRKRWSVAEKRRLDVFWNARTSMATDSERRVPSSVEQSAESRLSLGQCAVWIALACIAAGSSAANAASARLTAEWTPVNAGLQLQRIAAAGL